jgi:putative endonuclease
MHNRKLGIDGEAAVEQWYLEHGFRLVVKNWRCRDGEVDLIMTDGQTLVFCEVKSRSSVRFGHPFEAVTPRKQQRIRRLATLFLAGQSEHYAELRFDVAAVMSGEVEVLQAAF